MTSELAANNFLNDKACADLTISWIQTVAIKFHFPSSEFFTRESPEATNARQLYQWQHSSHPKILTLSNILTTTSIRQELVLHNCYGNTCFLVQYSWFSHGTSECRELLANSRRPFGFPPNWSYILRQLIKRLRVAGKSSRAVNSCFLRRAIWIVTAPASLIAFKLFRLARNNVLSAPPPAPRWGHMSPTGVRFLWRMGVFTFGRTL